MRISIVKKKMLDRLPTDLVHYVLRFAPRCVPTLRLVCRLPWTSSLVRLLAEARLSHRYTLRARRMRTCVCSGCGEPAVETVVFFYPKAFATTSPYCRDHLPMGLLAAAALYTSDGSMDTWW